MPSEKLYDVSFKHQAIDLARSTVVKFVKMRRLFEDTNYLKNVYLRVAFI